MLADAVDHLVGVDTHRDHHAAAVTDTAGAARAQTRVATDAFGYRRLLAFAAEHAPGRRAWAIEGTGSFGSGLTAFLLEHGDRDRPSQAPGPTQRSEVR
jgi:transposase